MQPSRGRLLIMCLGLAALAACGDTAATESTTTSTTAATTTTATTTTTTSTTLAGPTELRASTITVLDPGTYVAPGFWSSFTLTVDELGWQSLGSRDLWVYLQYVEPGRASVNLDLSLVAHSPNGTPEGVASRIADAPETEVTRPAEPTTLDGYDAVTLDVLVPESDFGHCGDPSTTGNSRFEDGAGLSLLYDTNSPGLGYWFGVRLCREARIWVVDVDGSTITIIAATVRPEQFDDLIPVAERLLAGVDFGG
jgi:hypothetical protein